jgi:hypothetical protein
VGGGGVVGGPGVLRYVYRGVVDGERDDELLVRDEPVQVEAVVAFRGRSVVVERIEELHERDASGGDLGERLEAGAYPDLPRDRAARLNALTGASARTAPSSPSVAPRCRGEQVTNLMPPPLREQPACAGCFSLAR